MKKQPTFLVALLLLTILLPVSASAALPAFAKISEGFEKVACVDLQSSSPKGLFNVWQRKKDAQVLLELPKTYVGKSYFIALTLSSGDRYAGLQSGEWVVQWRKYDERLALIAPNLTIKAPGEPEAKASVKRLFTDQVLLDVPILAIGPNGGPVIDGDSLMVSNASRFFGAAVRVSNSRIRSIKSAKVFPHNTELAFEIVGAAGRFQTLHYSLSEVPTKTGYKPRKADERVGYFTTAYSDLSKYDDKETRIRFINRWRLEKRDPKLKLSPPKTPIRFYIEHTAPVRYRRWIKAGVGYWNKAFEEVGIVDAIVIEYQDATTKQHMEKDPEDVRYNFIRWLNNDIGTAIGPSRVHPETGEILDADIILTDGWIRHFNFNYHDLMPKLAMEGVSAETLAWLGRHPNWDPRLRMAAPSMKNYLRNKFAAESQEPMAGFSWSKTDPSLIGDDEYDGLIGMVSQKNGLCMAASSRSIDLAIARLDWRLALMDDDANAKKKRKKKKPEDKDEKDDDKKAGKDDKDDDDDDDKEDKDGDDDDDKKSADKKSDVELLDGIPEWFVGPLLADLVAHEVGHTLGLRHNFKASAQMTLAEINSEEVKGKKTMAASVMDYIPINYRHEAGDVQGDYGMIDLGPYDFWAIEYGYTLDEKKLPAIVKRCSEPELQYATDEDTSGPDPLARRYDFTKDPLDYAEEQMELAKIYRERILDKFVKDGESWAQARRGYELTLGMQTRNGSMMSNWIGGAFIHRDKKGDPGNRPPVEVVPAEQQRKALQFVIDYTFKDEAYGLTPELLERMSVSKWLDARPGDMNSEGAWPIHDRILGVQAAALTWLMNPTTLRRVYDNELRLPEDQETLTLPELLTTINKAVWEELDKECPAGRNDRKPMISSLRRNLQREHMQRLVDLILETNESTAAAKPISNLARLELKDIKKKIDASLKKCGAKMDAYSKAHLSELSDRIKSALDAGYTYNAAGAAGGLQSLFLLGKEKND